MGVPVPPEMSGPVTAVGIDVVSVDRFAGSLSRTPALADRLFRPDERITPSGSPRTAASLAARFAAKEALAKSLGAPAGLRWHDCWIVSRPSGRPELMVRGTIRAAADAQGVLGWRVSLSHDAGIAAAVVVAIGAREVPDADPDVHR